MNTLITIPDFVALYRNVQAAATALEVDRITLWRWQRQGDRFPGAWGWKATALAADARRAAGERAGGTNA